LFITFPHSSFVAINCPVFKFNFSKNSLLNVEKLFGVSVSSNPSTLYDTIPLSGAVMYSAPEFNCFSSSVL